MGKSMFVLTESTMGTSRISNTQAFLREYAGAVGSGEYDPKSLP